jgi:hypothetical protein
MPRAPLVRALDVGQFIETSLYYVFPNLLVLLGKQFITGYRALR